MKAENPPFIWFITQLSHMKILVLIIFLVCLDITHTESAVTYVKDGSQGRRPLSGTRKNLECHPISSSSQAVWYKDDIQIDTNQDKYIILDQSRIQIARLAKEDTGSYRCTRQQNDLTDQNAAFNLFVLYAPEHAELKHISGNKVEFNIVLWCHLHYPGNPSITSYKWLSGYGEVLDETEEPFFITKQSTLTKEYKCYASNTIGSSPYSEIVTVELTGQWMIKQSESLQESSTRDFTMNIKLSCVASEFDIIWRKNGLQIKNISHHTVHNLTRYDNEEKVYKRNLELMTSNFKSINISFGKYFSNIYTCEVKDEENKKETLHYIPLFYTMPSMIHTTLGQVVKFTCPICDEQDTTKWTFNNGQLPHNVNVKRCDIHIANTSQEHFGTYKCISNMTAEDMPLIKQVGEIKLKEIHSGGNECQSDIDAENKSSNNTAPVVLAVVFALLFLLSIAVFLCIVIGTRRLLKVDNINEEYAMETRYPSAMETRYPSDRQRKDRDDHNKAEIEPLSRHNTTNSQGRKGLTGANTRVANMLGLIFDIRIPGLVRKSEKDETDILSETKINAKELNNTRELLKQSQTEKEQIEKRQKELEIWEQVIKTKEDELEAKMRQNMDFNQQMLWRDSFHMKTVPENSKAKMPDTFISGNCLHDVIVNVTGQKGAGKSTLIEEILGTPDKKEIKISNNFLFSNDYYTEFKNKQVTSIRFLEFKSLNEIKDFENTDLYLYVVKDTDNVKDKFDFKKIKNLFIIKSFADESNENASNFEEQRSELHKKFSKNCDMFFVNCHDKSKFEFQTLIASLICTVSVNKQPCLLYGLPPTHMSLYSYKHTTMQKRIANVAYITAQKHQKHEDNHLKLLTDEALCQMRMFSIGEHHLNQYREGRPQETEECPGTVQAQSRHSPGTVQADSLHDYLRNAFNTVIAEELIESVKGLDIGREDIYVKAYIVLHRFLAHVYRCAIKVHTCDDAAVKNDPNTDTEKQPPKAQITESMTHSIATKHFSEHAYWD